MDAKILTDLDRFVKEELPDIIHLRRDLHAHPQLGFEETHAAGRVREQLEGASVDFKAGIATTGIVGWIRPTDAAAAKGKGIGLRADMDALPIQEETGLQYASQNPGLMHACGHDGHTAMLVGAARVLAKMRDRLPRPVKLFFQPAEEGGAGAHRMIEAGAMDAALGGFEVGAAFAQHAKSDIALGAFGIREGPWGARADGIHIEITGHGTHACRPEDSRDPIVAASSVVMNLQTVVSRNVRAIEPAVVSIGQIHGGTKENIIPDSVTMDGTVRTYDDAVAERVLARIDEIVRQTAAALGCSGKMEVRGTYPVSRNAPEAARYAVDMASRIAGKDGVIEVPPTMGAEDFSYFGKRVPTCFIWVGMQPAGRAYPKPHGVDFDFNDDALPHGIKLFCLLALGADQLV